VNALHDGLTPETETLTLEWFISPRNYHGGRYSWGWNCCVLLHQRSTWGHGNPWGWQSSQYGGCTPRALPLGPPRRPLVAPAPPHANDGPWLPSDPSCEGATTFHDWILSLNDACTDTLGLKCTYMYIHSTQTTCFPASDHAAPMLYLDESDHGDCCSLVCCLFIYIHNIANVLTLIHRLTGARVWIPATGRCARRPISSGRYWWSFPLYFSRLTACSDGTRPSWLPSIGPWTNLMHWVIVALLLGQNFHSHSEEISKQVLQQALRVREWRFVESSIAFI